jgi:hypothetical protein
LCYVIVNLQIHEEYLSGTVCVTSLFLRKMLDFETDPKLIDLSINIRDKGRLSLQRTFTFTLMDENELPKVSFGIELNSTKQVS